MGYQGPKITAPVSFRIALPAKQKADGLRKVWDAIAAAKGENLDDKGKAVPLDISHVFRTVLERGLDEEVAQITGGKGFPPADDEKAWAELLRSVTTSLKSASKSR